MKWYKYLIRQQDVKNKGMSLMENETIEKNNLIVCWKRQNIGFGKFNSYLDFVKYMLFETEKGNRCFYELISGSSAQKPYFDIEFYVSDSIIEPQELGPNNEFTLPTQQADESIEKLVNLIEEELPPLSTNRSHIFVFTSHKDLKRSYHIVVEGFHFSDNKSNKLFSEKIRKRMPEHWQNIIDTSMYKSSQQFRITGSCKFGTKRFKTLHSGLTRNGYGKRGWIPKIEIESEEHEILLLIEASLITQISGGILLPNLIDESKPDSQRFQYGNTEQDRKGNEYFEPLTPLNIEEALRLCHKVAGLEYGDPRFPYSYLKIIEDNGESSIILLKRRFASMCRTCHRIHEHENPFLLIVGLERDIYLDCRRNQYNKKFYIGKLGPSKTIETQIIESSATTESEIVRIAEPKTPTPPKIPLPVISLPNLFSDLSTASQQVAPKIKLKEKPKPQKEPMILQFKF